MPFICGVQIFKITLHQFSELHGSVENIEPILFTKINLVPIKLTISMGGRVLWEFLGKAYRALSTIATYLDSLIK